MGLTKNLLRAINAQSHELPPLDAFPKSHIVTFKYYLGVIHFLDEQYTQVWNHFWLGETESNASRSFRLKNTSLPPGECATGMLIRTESAYYSLLRSAAVAYMSF